MASQSDDAQELTNTKRIRMVVDSVLFCAKQGICMKGQVKRPLYQDNDEFGDNEDQVLALSKFFLHMTGNESLEPSNLIFLTKVTQDQILETCREMLTSNLVAEVKKAGFYSLIAEKMLKDDDGLHVPLFVRFIDKDLKIREELLQYISAIGPGGKRVPGESCDETFSKNIVRVITEIGLDMDLCRGLNFDRLSLDYGPKVAQRLQATYNKAIYIHIRSDLLNICVASTCDQRQVGFMWYNMKFVMKLFTENKEIKELLEQMIKEVMPEADHSRLIELCHSDWGTSSPQQFGNFLELFPALLAALDETQEGSEWQKWRRCFKDDDQSFWASTSRMTMEKFEFIMCLVIVTNCLKLTLDLTQELQKICYDSNTIREKVSELHNKLVELKSKINEHHATWYEKAVSIATKIQVKPEKVERVGKETPPNPDESISDHYLNLITIPFVDHIKSQIEIRFNEASLVAFDGLAIMPSNILENPTTWEKAASRFLKRYKHDLPDLGFFDGQLNLWQTSWKFVRMDNHPRPETALELLDNHDLKCYYTMLHTGVKIFLTMPVIPCEQPRLLASINYELDPWSMSDNYLNALALLSISHGKDLKTEDVIERYQKKYTLPLCLDELD